MKIVLGVKKKKSVPSHFYHFTMQLFVKTFMFVVQVINKLSGDQVLNKEPFHGQINQHR